jgi:hypothetical protein
MELLADGLLIAAALTAAIYCRVLAGRLRRLSDLDRGVGAAIGALSARVEALQEAVAAARRVTGASVRDLGERTARAEVAAGRLELLLAALHEREAGETVVRPLRPARDSAARDGAARAEPAGEGGVGTGGVGEGGVGKGPARGDRPQDRPVPAAAMADAPAPPARPAAAPVPTPAAGPRIEPPPLRAVPGGPAAAPPLSAADAAAAADTLILHGTAPAPAGGAPAEQLSRALRALLGGGRA